MPSNYEPVGIKFFDGASNRVMMLVKNCEPREELRGWLLYRHPDGQWVTLRKASDDEIHKVAAMLSEQMHGESEPDNA